MSKHTQTTKAPYKYTLKELLIKKYGAKSNIGRGLLAQYLGISRKTLSLDLNILRTDAATIPHTRIVCYAQFFDVSLEQIFNPDVKH